MCCIEVLERIINKKQIGFFRKAIREQPALSPDEMMKMFDNQGWNYFNLPTSKILVNSFDKSYRDMS